MPNNPFDRTIINPREKPLSEDVNIYLAQMDRATRFFAKALFSTTAGSPVSGFSQGSFRAVESSPQAMSVALKAGLGFQDLPGDVPTDIDGILGLNDLESYKPLVLTADLTIPIPTAPTAPNSRIDIIEVRADRLKTDNQSRQVFDNAANSFSPTAVDKTLEFLLDGSKLGSVASPADSIAAVSLKQGVAGTPGVAPATTVGYIKIAEVFVDGDVVIINQGDITDFRPQLIDSLRSNITKEIVIPAAAGEAQTGGGGASSFNTGTWFSQSGALFQIDIPLSGYLKAGDRILGINVYLKDVVGSQSNVRLFEQAMPGSIDTLVSAIDLSDNSGVAQTVPITAIDFNSSTNVLENDKAYHVQVSRLAAPLFHQFYGIGVVYDTPL